MTYTEQAQPLLDSITDIAGNTWHKCEVDSYNRLTAKINETANRPIKPGSLTEQEREFYLDQRHRLYTSIMLSPLSIRASKI